MHERACGCLVEWPIASVSSTSRCEPDKPPYCEMTLRVVACFVQLYSQLLGEEPLPWEGDRLTAEVTHKLGVFADNVLALLSRDPAARPPMHEFALSCEAIFDAPKLPQNPGAINTTI